MRIEVSALEIGAVLRVPFDEHIDSDSDEFTLDQPVVGEIEVARTGRTVRLSGQLATTVRMVCGRCLEPYRQRLAVPLKEEFLTDPADDTTSRGNGQLESTDFVHPVGPDRVLDVSEMIRQHLLLAAPMVPLCSPSCRGLCPQCGTNWNYQPCTCVQVTQDPRLAPLQQFGKGRKTGSPDAPR